MDLVCYTGPLPFFQNLAKRQNFGLAIETKRLMPSHQSTNSPQAARKEQWRLRNAAVQPKLLYRLQTHHAATTMEMAVTKDEAIIMKFAQRILGTEDSPARQLCIDDAKTVNSGGVR